MVISPGIQLLPPQLTLDFPDVDSTVITDHFPSLEMQVTVHGFQLALLWLVTGSGSA